MRNCILRFLLLLGPSLLVAQSADTLATSPDKRLRKSSLIPIPLVFYTPETQWGGGAAVLYAFRLRGQPDSQRPSQVQLGLAYTQRKQVLAYLPFQFFSKNEKRNIFGELGYYRYVYKLFGIGNETPADSEETYQANYPRLRVNALQLVRPHWYLGLRYWFDDYRIVKPDPAGLLVQGVVTGSRGGIISGGGPLLNFDSRDNIFFPTTGTYVEAELFFNRQAFGSDFDFFRFSVDASKYFSGEKKRVLALNAWFVSSTGEVPFQQLALLGGPRKMRGYFEGRYREKNLWMLQAEYRVPLFWRLGGVVFGGIGSVGPDLGGLFGQQVHATCGAGLRVLLADDDHINLRIDVGANEHGEIFPYLTVREAF